MILFAIIFIGLWVVIIGLSVAFNIYVAVGRWFGVRQERRHE